MSNIDINNAGISNSKITTSDFNEDDIHAPIANEDDIRTVPISRITGQIVGVTGNEPHAELFIQQLVQEKLGFVGSKDMWQHDQVIVIGRQAFNREYLEKTVRFAKTFGFVCRYMSQEDFLEVYLKGEEVRCGDWFYRLKRRLGIR